MHNFSYIERILKLARKIAVNYRVDEELLVLWAYLHGVIHLDETRVIDFFRKENIKEEEIKRIVQVAWDSQKDKVSELIEGTILHDAHLLEGWKTFWIIKTLVTGTIKGQDCLESLDYLEENVLGKFECILPESQEFYKQKEQFARDFLIDLKSNL